MAKTKTTKSDPISIGIDLGTGSLAVFARLDKNVIWHKSLLMVNTTASLAERRTVRRMVKTRIAHKAREYWWNECARSAGIPLLKDIIKVSEDKYRIENVDEKLKREHPSDGDDTCFNGALLRIMILEGKIAELAPWQVYKAVHDAIQKRGYDAQVPWKVGYHLLDKDDFANEHMNESQTQSSTARKEGKKKRGKGGDQKDVEKVTDEEGKTQPQLDEFVRILHEMTPDKTKHFCCYFDAYRSGLWDPLEGILTTRQTHDAEQRAITDWKGYIPPRKMVEDELQALLTAIATRFPHVKPLYVMYGSSLVPYGSHPKHASLVKEVGGLTGLVPGRTSDWQGVLGQKIPRFENRGVKNCVLIPRFKVCKVPDSKALPPNDEQDRRELRLYAKFVLLSQLKNLRVIKSARIPEPLTPEECREAFHQFEGKLRFTSKELRTWLNSKNFKIAPGALDELSGAKVSGRCAYSRPALRMVCRWLYEGWNKVEGIAQIKEEFIGNNNDPMKGIVTSDLIWTDYLSPNGWQDSFYVPHRPADLGNDMGANHFVERIKYPVVRHRLGLLLKVLRELQSDLKVRGFDLSDVRIGLEVIKDESRNSFLGEMAKKEIDRNIRNNAKINNSIRDICEEFKIHGRKEFEKVKLAYAQGFVDPYNVDLYNGRKVDQEKQKKAMLTGIKKDLYDIDHIVPEALGGPNEQYNKILTRKDLNRNKKKRMTPFEWLSDTDQWDDYLRIVEELPTKSQERIGISDFTKRLLTSPDAVALVSKRTDLQATGYVEKAAQSLIYLAFGWPEAQVKGSQRRVVCVPGRMVATIRREAELNDLLYPKPSLAKKERTHKGASIDSETKAKKKVSPFKNRDNPKHHILDAALLSFIPEWALNPAKKRFFHLPSFAKERWFTDSLLKDHDPVVWNVEKPSLFETRKSLLDISHKDHQKYITVKKHVHQGGAPSIEWTMANLQKSLQEGAFNYPPGYTKKSSQVTKALKKVLKNKPKKIPEEIFLELGQCKVRLKSLKTIEVYSPDRHLVDKYGGVLESQTHKGIIIWRPLLTKIWLVAVVASWSTVKQTIERLEAANHSTPIELWENGKMIKRGDVLKIGSDSLKSMPAGRYIVASTRENGQLAFRGKKELVVINQLITKGKASIEES